jgi:type IV pilus assembly protein PilX
MKHRIPASNRQQGASLVIALMFLIVLTILGLVSVRSSTLHERMAGNDRDRALAFEAAEAALRDAEVDILINLTTASPFDAACTDGLCVPSTVATPQWRAVAWDNASSRVYGTESGAGDYPVDVALPPRYIVELLPDLPPGAGNSMNANARSSTSGGTAYRITARGWGRRDTTQVMLQSVYVKQ